MASSVCKLRIGTRPEDPKKLTVAS